MFSTKKKVTAAITLGLASAFLLSACSMGSGSTSDSSSEPKAPETSESTPMEMDPAANLVGPGCAAYADAVPDGAGSVEGMSQDPVATAVSLPPGT